MNHEKLKEVRDQAFTYDSITGHDLWLEDKCGGQLSRYATGTEDSVWVCNACEEVGVDSEEHDCDDNQSVPAHAWSS